MEDQPSSGGAGPRPWEPEIRECLRGSKPWSELEDILAGAKRRASFREGFKAFRHRKYWLWALAREPDDLPHVLQIDLNPEAPVVFPTRRLASAEARRRNRRAPLRNGMRWVATAVSSEVSSPEWWARIRERDRDQPGLPGEPG